jgi:hypothetical protein
MTIDRSERAEIDGEAVGDRSTPPVLVSGADFLETLEN